MSTVVKKSGDAVFSRRSFVAGLAAASGCALAKPVMAGVSTSSTAWKESILHSFGDPDGTLLYGGVIVGPDGYLYGTAFTGGAENFGTIYRIGRRGAFEVIHTFSPADGHAPVAGLTRGPGAWMYGSTSYGGVHGSGCLFRVKADGTFQLLYSLDSLVASHPNAPLTLASDGHFYGTTVGGGDHGHGVLFRMSPQGHFNVLHSFTFEEGYSHTAALSEGPDGFLYGAALLGGDSSGTPIGGGTLYRSTLGGKVNVLHRFKTDGSAGSREPYAGLTYHPPSGKFFGVTRAGGQFEGGTAFTMTTSGRVRLLHSFATAGRAPLGQLLLHSDGLFYGTAHEGGPSFGGTVFSLSATGEVEVVHAFDTTIFGDAVTPRAGVVLGNDGGLYGSTESGGSQGGGTVFRLKPSARGL